MKNIKTRDLTITSALIALSLLLTFFGISFFPATPFLKIDFALVPIVIITVLVSKQLGLLALLINFLLVFYRDPSGWIFNAFAGMYFIVGLIITMYLLKNILKKDYHLFILSLIIATIFTAILTTLTNHFVLIPLLFPTYQTPLFTTFEIYLPFNLLKFTLVSIVSLLIIPQIQKVFS